MKNLYSHKEINQLIKVIIIILISIITIGAHNSYAEGTKQLAPKADDRVYVAFGDAKHGNFGNYDGMDTERIYIHIQDSDNELVYFGFSQFVNDGHTPANSSEKDVNAWMRIKDPNGNIVWPVAGSHIGEKVPGNMITSLAQVKNGPNQICGSGGYDAFVFYPTSGSGDYYIEFSAAESSDVKRPLYTEWWDITVATQGAGTKAIDGRVFAKHWALVSPYILTPGSDRLFNGKVYCYAEDASGDGGYVTELDFENSGFRGSRFSLAFNSTGTDSTPDDEFNRKSVEDEYKLSPEYKIFLNEPDEICYPSAEGYGRFIVDEENDYPRLFGCPGKYFFRVAVEKTGYIELLLDFDGTPNKYDPGTRDRIITTLFHPYPNEEGILIRDIPWDGLDGVGNIVADLEAVSVTFDYYQKTFHLPMYDVEHMTRGLVPRTVRPETPTPYIPKLYWDDSNITESLPGDQLKVDLTGEEAPSHYWVEDEYGDDNSINTYWHPYSSGVVTTCKLEETRDCALFEPGTISGTVFNDLNHDGVMDAGELALIGAEVRLYWDKTYNKVIDAGDELLETFTTQTPGSFGYPEGLGNFIFSPDIGKEYLVEVSYGSNIITGENPKTYAIYSSGQEFFDQFFGVIPLPEISLTVSENTIYENDESSGIIAELDYPTLLPVTITLAYAGTAEASDYNLTPGLNATNSTTIEIPVGESRGEIDLSSVHDLLDEDDEIVEISIISSLNAVEIVEQSAVITIINGTSLICDLIDIDPLDNSISENALTDDLVHITAHATDANGDAITYFLLDDAGGRFKIDISTGVVTVADASLIDFETDASHLIRIEARSSDGSTVAADFTIVITDVDGTGGDTDHAITNLIDNDPLDNSISENALTDDLVHITALATDADGDAITYFLLDNASGRFKIDISTGVVTVADASLIDFETDASHLIRIEARSSDGSTVSADFTIVITDVDGTGGDTDHAITNLIDNDPLDNSISENALTDDLVHITALATDADGDAITYYLLDDAGGRFKIDISTGVVTVADASLIDFETDASHLIRIEARSSDGSTVSADFTIVITDVDGTGGDTDHAITNLIDNDPLDNSISENALTDDLVHITALATDADGDAITYYLLDDAGGRFKIDISTGVVTVADASLIDFETDASHLIRIEARSSDGSVIAEDFTVVITNVDGGDTDHPITDLRDNEEHENVISENVLNDAPVYITALATDLDNDAITYHLIDDDNGRFKIDEVSGVVTVKDESQIDFETNTNHSIRIEARSADGSKIAGDFPIFVTDVDETGGDTDHAIANLIDNDPDDNVISEYEANNSPVHITALATDEDGDVISYHLLDDAGGRFKIDNSSGIVAVADESLLDFEMDESHLIRIEARSSDGSTVAENFTITITDVIEYLIAYDDASEVNEDTVLTGDNLLSNDYKAPGTSLTIDISPVVDVTDGKLVIHNDGTYTYTPDLNFSGTDSFVYSVCDDGTPQQCDQATVNITIQSVNDAPLARDDEAEVNEDEILNGASVLENDTDVDSDVLVINTSPIEDVEHGSLSINSDGTYTYIPDADFNGSDGFTYELCDNETLAACGQASVTISVLPVNDAPQVFDFEMEVEEASLNNPINLESPYDPDGDELSVKILSTVDFGEIVLAESQILSNNDMISVDDLLNLEFNARERFIGELTMLYEVSDESGLSAQGRVKISVIPIDVFIPNAITPNNDNFNDKFKIVGLEKFPGNSLQIFNRWGNIVYKKRSYDNSWDGYGNVKGQISHDRLPPGTYYYIFKFGVKKQPLSGYVYMTY